MNYRIVLVLISTFGLSACAHKTPHEYCTDADNQAKFRDYDQCIEYANANGTTPRWKKALGAVMEGTADGLKQAGQRKPSSTNCHSMPNGYGGFNTTCN